MIFTPFDCYATKGRRWELRMGHILDVTNLCVYYAEQTHHIIKKNSPKQICKNISFRMEEGQVVGLLGESGCGKSTLAKTILGINTEYTGEIQHFSEHPQMVFQDPYSSLNPVKKIGWIVEEPLRIKGGYSKYEMHRKAIEMLEKVGLDEKYAQRYPGQLSGGQRQRVCIATALMLEPKLLIADEPVSALDVTIQAQIIRLLLELHRDMGLAILFISHDLRVMYQMCDQVMVMKNGEIVEVGAIDEVYHNPKHAYTKLLIESAGI